jgi:hypothetical protein
VTSSSPGQPTIIHPRVFTAPFPTLSVLTLSRPFFRISPQIRWCSKPRNVAKLTWCKVAIATNCLALTGCISASYGDGHERTGSLICRLNNLSSRTYLHSFVTYLYLLLGPLTKQLHVLCSQGEPHVEDGFRTYQNAIGVGVAIQQRRAHTGWPSKRALESYCKCYCVASVAKMFTLNCRSCKALDTVGERFIAR